MTGAHSTAGRTLVAGVGNIFQRDDAFGVEVVRLLADRPRPPGVQIRDFGIRGVHLAYDLLDGCDLFVLVDAAARGAEPGTVTVLEVEPRRAPADGGDPLAAPVIDAHGLAPDDIFALLASLGGRPGRSLVVACEPADTGAGNGTVRTGAGGPAARGRGGRGHPARTPNRGKGGRRDDRQAGEGGRDSRGNRGGD